MLFVLGSTAFGQIIINEVLYDPSNNALDGDANGDGVYDQEADAFIEFVNAGTTYVDMSGYEIWDDTTGGSLRFTFPAGTVIAPKGVVVVFGGGTPTGYFGNALVLVDTAVDGMSLNNTGEVIIIKDATGKPVLSFDSDALSNNPNESYTRNPDFTGEFEQHGTNTSRLFSPGLTVDSMPFAREIHLQGVIDFTTPAAGSTGKAIHLRADSAISDLSNYGIGVANNGGGTDGREFNLPAISVAAGEDVLVVRDSAAMAAYMVECFAEFEHIIVDTTEVISQNGDDAIELFLGLNVIDTYGDANVDGTGMPWEYSDSWAYLTDTGWYTATPECTDSSENMYYASCRYPICKDVNVSSITVQGKDGVSSISTKAGTLQMEAIVTPKYAVDTTYTWSVDDTQIATIDNNGMLTAAGNGTVKVTATAKDGSGTSGSADVTITNQESSVVDVDHNLVIYPNPANDFIRIHSTTPVSGVVFMNISGQEVLNVSSDFEKIDLSSLKPGVYYANVVLGGDIAHVRLVKQ